MIIASLRRNAVLLTILFAYSVTIASVTYAFVAFNHLNASQYVDNIFTKYSVIAQIYREHIMKHTSDAILEANLAVYGLYRIEGEVETNRVFDKATVLKRIGYQQIENAMLLARGAVVTRHQIKDIRATMLKSKGKIYFYIESWRGGVLLLDEKLKPYFPTPLLSAWSTIVFFVTLAFFLIYHRIRPLQRLTQKVMRYGTGDRDVSFGMKGGDEVAILANELETARGNINRLIEARTLFLRNVMHELKTPIAKGRITAEMVTEVRHKERFIRIFRRLEELINQFALIEKISSGYVEANRGTCRLIDVIDEAVDQSMIDPAQISVDVDSRYKIDCDFQLMATAVKNMIDNGIKYSTDRQVAITVEEEELCFENRGERLRHPLHFYVQPFTKENPSRDSFGLGLYLVDSILKLHGMVLAYAHEEGVNRFYFAR